MPRSRRSTRPRTKKAAAATSDAPSRSPLAGIVDAAYQAGTVVAGTARWLIAGTVRAAESIVAEAEMRREASATDGVPARKPLARVRSRTRSARRRRRAS